MMIASSGEDVPAGACGAEDLADCLRLAISARKMGAPHPRLKPA
jgi:hypothetical protein